MTVRVRFAPSPSGHLHMGNVRTALYNWLFVRQKGGSLILRIEDTDLKRSEKSYEDNLMEDLKWLGLQWDEGVDMGGTHGPYRQTDRFPVYRTYAERLRNDGKAYYCFCSPQQLKRERQRQLDAGDQVRYGGQCRNLSSQQAAQRLAAGEEAALRLRVREGHVGFHDIVFGSIQVETSGIGDFILLRSDGSAQYNFACSVDDALMRISHVIRGEGHISNTHRQILIYEALGFTPPEFAHLSTILDKNGAKLSKRQGAISVGHFRHRGYLPEALANYLALLGWVPREEGHEILTMEELIAKFELSRVNRSPAIFDLDKLKWVNRNHIKSIEPNQLIDLVLPFLQHHGLIPDDPSSETKQWVGDVVDAVINYVDTLEDIVQQTRFIFHFDPEKGLVEPAVQEVLSQGDAHLVISEFFKCIQKYDFLDVNAFHEVLAVVKQATGRKGKALFLPIRVGLTAQASGPELDKLLPILEHGQQLALPVAVLRPKDRVKAILERIS